MPSSTLQVLSDQIEQLETDDFGKFYMYSSLLNVITVRDEKAFVYTLPLYKGLFGPPKSVYIGKPNVDFYSLVTSYQNQFKPNSAPNIFTVAKKIIGAYLRKGQLADLSFIIDKMVAHLNVIHIDNMSNTPNKMIYDHIFFNSKKTDVYQVINTVLKANHHFLSCIDNGINASLSACLVILGLTVVLAFAFSLVGLIIAAVMVGAGVYGLNNFYLEAMESFDKITNAYDQIYKLALRPDSHCVSKNENLTRFYHDSVFTPIMFFPITGIEQLSLDDEMAKCAADQRLDLRNRIKAI